MIDIPGLDALMPFLIMAALVLFVGSGYYIYKHKKEFLSQVLPDDPNKKARKNSNPRPNAKRRAHNTYHAEGEGRR
jgi:hypothetical protein